MPPGDNLFVESICLSTTALAASPLAGLSNYVEFANRNPRVLESKNV